MSEAAVLPGWVVISGGLLLGLVVGSFLNVVIHRLPRILEREWQRECAELTGVAPAVEDVPLSLATPRSRCPHCGTPIKARHNIPLVGYAWLRGRCASCAAPIGLRYPLVELLAGLATAAVAWRYGVTPEGIAAAVLTWTLIALAGIDIDHHLLPDRITLPLVWLGLLLSLGGIFATPQAAIIGAAAGYVSLWLVFHGFRLATGKEGMGFGDFKLLAVFGAWLGWQLLPQIVLVSSLVGAVTGIAMIAAGRHQRRAPIPFGPFLAAAGWIALMWGRAINEWYLGGL